MPQSVALESKSITWLCELSRVTQKNSIGCIFGCSAWADSWHLTKNNEVKLIFILLCHLQNDFVQHPIEAPKAAASASKAPRKALKFEGTPVVLQTIAANYRFQNLQILAAIMTKPGCKA